MAVLLMLLCDLLCVVDCDGSEKEVDGSSGSCCVHDVLRALCLSRRTGSRTKNICLPQSASICLKIGQSALWVLKTEFLKTKNCSFFFDGLIHLNPRQSHIFNRKPEGKVPAHSKGFRNITSWLQQPLRTSCRSSACVLIDNVCRSS